MPCYEMLFDDRFEKGESVVIVVVVCCCLLLFVVVVVVCDNPFNFRKSITMNC